MDTLGATGLAYYQKSLLFLPAMEEFYNYRRIWLRVRAKLYSAIFILLSELVSSLWFQISIRHFRSVIYDQRLNLCAVHRTNTENLPQLGLLQLGEEIPVVYFATKQLYLHTEMYSMYKWIGMLLSDGVQILIGINFGIEDSRIN